MNISKGYRGITGTINDNYAFNIAGFYKVRDFDNGISLFEFDISWDRYKGDHNPKFTVLFVVLNFILLDITVYNRHHAVDTELEFFNESSNTSRINDK